VAENAAGPAPAHVVDVEAQIIENNHRFTGDSDQSTLDYRRVRELILSDFRSNAAERRAALTAVTDAWLQHLFALSGAPQLGATLVAVGGYGRGDLSPGSDLDLLLLVPDSTVSSLGEVADRFWYPIWDSKVRVDHSVRTPAETRKAAGQDLRVLLGLLDARVIAGDGDASAQMRTSVLADWRGFARDRLAGLQETVQRRRERYGDLAHVLEPDIKEAYGGLRDDIVVRAVAASWVTDVPREGLRESQRFITTVRDALHDELMNSGRKPTDQLLLQEQDAVAASLNIADADELLRELSSAGRKVAYASDVMWHRIDRILTRPRKTLLRRRVKRVGPQRVPLAEGVVVHDAEVTLSLDARPEKDPVLVLRVAAAAAQSGLSISPAAMQRLAEESAPLPEPWPVEARESLVSLLGSGAHLISVWEAMDAAGIPVALIPEWSVVRSAPQRNALHIYTVDRHLVEAAARAGDYVRDVKRPDLLLVGALLHDIGKARSRDHTEVGVELVAAMAPRMGFDETDTAVLVDLVRHHLLLPDMATRRDLEDVSTIRSVAEAVGDVDTLDLLHALTKADAAATGPAAWSEWKAGLIDVLVRRTHALLQGEAPSVPQPLRILTDLEKQLLESGGVQVAVNETSLSGVSSAIVTVCADDRLGLLSTVAGVLALQRLHVRAADTYSVGDRVVSEWHVTALFGDLPEPVLLRADLARALNGNVDIASRLLERQSVLGSRATHPRVSFAEGASEQADVLEVRAHDEPALLFRIGAALAASGAYVTAARVSTMGSEVVDVFYLRRPDGARLSPDHQAAVVTTVLAALTTPLAAAG